MDQKKRNTKHIPAVEYEDFDADGNLIPSAAEEQYTVEFYHSPDFKYLYIFIYDPEDMQMTHGQPWPKHFKRLFPKAIKIPTEKEFDRLYRLHPDAQVIPVGADYILDNLEEEENEGD